MYLHPTFFRWIITAVVTVAFTGLQEAESQLATDTRRLKIEAKPCTSTTPRHENIVGTCMFSLECQERRGTVIGACYDRFLVGACCVDAAERPTSTSTISSLLLPKQPSFGQELLLQKRRPAVPSSHHLNIDRIQQASLSLSALRNQYNQNVGDSMLPGSERLQPVAFGYTNPRIAGGKHARPEESAGSQVDSERDATSDSESGVRFPVRPTIGSILSAVKASVNERIMEEGGGVEAVVPLHASGSRLPTGKLSAVPAPAERFSLFSLPLEAVANDSDSAGLSSTGNNANLYSKNGESIISLESTPLNTKSHLYQAVGPGASSMSSKSEPMLMSSKTTEEPPKLSTFMYVDMKGEDGDNMKKYQYNVETTTPSATSMYTEMVSSGGGASGGASGEKVWNVILQLASQVSETTEANDSGGGVGSGSGSDETFVTFNTAPVAEETTVMSSFDDVDTTVAANGVRHPLPYSSVSSEETTLSEYLKDYVDTTTLKSTARPWASSTYQVHTFKYPERAEVTTPSAAGGSLTTWSEVSGQSSLPTPTTTTTSTTSTTPRTTTRTTTTTTTPTTTTSTTTTTTTTKPTTTTTALPPLRLRPRPTTEKVWYTRPTTTEKVYTLPPRKKLVPVPISSLGVKATVAPLTSLIMASKVGGTSKNPSKDSNLHSDENDSAADATFENSMQHEDLDANLDDFVNQVVQGLAGTLDHLDLDEMILQASAKPGEDSPSTLHPLGVLSDPFPSTTNKIKTKPESSSSKPSSTSTSTNKPPKKVTTTTTTQKSTSRRPQLDFRSECGIRPMLKQGRIVGGKPSRIGKWPWQALIREATWLGLFSKNKCGGVLISKKYVLTAAHCQPGFLATLTVVLGDFDISSEADSPFAPITKNVKRVIVHRDYNAQTFENDIALLELESPIEFKEHIVPICMPNEDDIHVGRHAFVTGWGRLKYGGGVPQELHEVDVPIINNTECQNMFLRSGHVKAIRESFICAGYEKGMKDSCEGDSGGPLALQRPNGQWVLAGTVSHGIKCAYPNLPGVYMRMTFYKPWIKRVTGVS